MRKSIIRAIGATLASVAMLPAFASEQYKPAMFDFSGEQLISSLDAQLQSSIEKTAVLYCQSDVDKAGDVGRTNCYSKSGSEDLTLKIEGALQSFAFTPAHVDGEAVPVKVSYRVGFNRFDNKLAAVLIPNLGTMQDRYGRDYIAPQERLDMQDWYGRYNQDSWVNGAPFLGEGPISRVAATVNPDGKADVVRAVDIKRAYKRDAKIVKSALKKSRFIPGFVDGKAVPMGYLAVVNYGQPSGEAVSSR